MSLGLAEVSTATNIESMSLGLVRKIKSSSGEFGVVGCESGGLSCLQASFKVRLEGGKVSAGRVGNV